MPLDGSRANIVDLKIVQSPLFLWKECLRVAQKFDQGDRFCNHQVYAIFLTRTLYMPGVTDRVASEFPKRECPQIDRRMYQSSLVWAQIGTVCRFNGVSGAGPDSATL